VAATDGRAADRIALFAALARAPWSFDFFQALRRIEGIFADRPRLGKAVRPADEPVRLSQEASVAFAPSTLSGFEEQAGGLPPRLEQRFFGLLGPNGPLPLHLTEYARDRLRHHGDRTLVRFLDLFHHRLALLFYRAWTEARPTVQHDRPAEDRFAVHLGSLAGYGSPGTRGRDAVPDHSKLFFVGHLARSARNAEGLASILEGYFGLPVRVEQLVLGWLALPRDQRTALGGERRPSGMLGHGTVLGDRVRDVQSRFRIVMGPMDLDRFGDLLPGGRSLARLMDWVRNYVGFEFDWEAQLVLARDEVPGVRLGREGHLAWTAWLGARPRPTDADDLTLAPERGRPRGRALAAAA
jgi:type VI secretion system protein ImpH